MNGLIFFHLRYAPLVMSILYLRMSREEIVIVGFSNAQGQCTARILEEKCANIERLNKKLKLRPIVVKAIQYPPVDAEHLKNIITQRRNQALLSNFLNISDEEDITQLYQDQEEARQRLHAIEEELQTAQVIAADFKVNKFTSETKASEAVAYAYLREFNNNL